jgi:HSP20 family molecular chaperone IbpA
MPEPIMVSVARREPQFYPVLFGGDWVEILQTFSVLTTEEHGLRVEEFLEDDEVVIRVEVPGIQPDTKVDITVRQGVVEVRVPRHQAEAQRSAHGDDADDEDRQSDRQPHQR